MNAAIPFPILKTARLILRAPNISDIEAIHYLRSDPEINAFIQRPEPQNTDTALAHLKLITSEFKKNKSITWGMAVRGSNLLIGTICLWNFSADRKTAEVGYALGTTFQQKGYMSEALKAVLGFGFKQYGFERIEAYTDYRNIPSKRLLKSHGFIPINDSKDPDNQNNEIFYLNR